VTLDGAFLYSFTLYIEDVIVVEKFGSDTVWEGTVSIFELKGHQKATMRK